MADNDIRKRVEASDVNVERQLAREYPQQARRVRPEELVSKEHKQRMTNEAIIAGGPLRRTEMNRMWRGNEAASKADDEDRAARGEAWRKAGKDQSDRYFHPDLHFARGGKVPAQNRFGFATPGKYTKR